MSLLLDSGLSQSGCVILERIAQDTRNGAHAVDRRGCGRSLTLTGDDAAQRHHGSNQKLSARMVLFGRDGEPMNLLKG